MKDFTTHISQALLNIEEKSRSNIFSWRGQFSPQLIECILDAYCLPDSVILDPFAGSGTVLGEAAARSFSAYGFEINPSAWSFSKVYEFTNVEHAERRAIIAELQRTIEHEFPVDIFLDAEISGDIVEERITRIGRPIDDRAKILCNALVVLLDIFNNKITNHFVQSRFIALAEMVRKLPYCRKKIKVDLMDARNLPLDDGSIDFALTSPPYINVFNYHQNYRRSVEVLGWDVLRVARSEIGSNRANRGNRFHTVVQYCIDMATVLKELARVLRPEARAVLVVGYESKVLGATLYNADIVEELARQSGVFTISLRQRRMFTNRFGEAIREDIINLERNSYGSYLHGPCKVGRAVAMRALTNAVKSVPDTNIKLLKDAIKQIEQINGTPIFNGGSYSDYHTRQSVMMVREEGE